MARSPRPTAGSGPAAREVALLLQGGGALGSYQAGVFEALAESPWQPNWLAGISIGAINAALIAGNPPAGRVAALRAFWEGITTRPGVPPVNPMLEKFFPEPQEAGALGALFLGQPGFFAPRPPYAWLGHTLPESFYDTSALKGTLERLVDFDRINAGPTRLSIGAVHVATGNLTYFDTHAVEDRPPTRIRAEHVMASGALPPGFPSVEVEPGEFYWDGGLVSNTPLAYVLEIEPRRHRLCFEVDVFSARGPVPRTLPEAAERDKDIRYSSRTRAGVNGFKKMQDIRVVMAKLLEQLPDAVRATPLARHAYAISCPATMDVVELVYRPTTPQGQSKDYAFGAGTMAERWAQGLADCQAVLAAAPWTAPFPPEVGVRRFDPLNPYKGPVVEA